MMEKMDKHVPDTVHFSIGYYQGRQSKKRWLCCHDDLLVMYECNKEGGEISLWCDGRKPTSADGDDEQPATNSRKRKQASASTRHDKEDRVDNIFMDLKEQHGERYDNPKLRLWARMIASGLHESTEEPPGVPAFQNGEPKRRKRESISDVLTGAVEAIAKCVEKKTPGTPASDVPSHSTTQVGVSPGKAADLRMKNLQQLRYLQTLYEDNILSDQELAEQKRIVLDALRKLT